MSPKEKRPKSQPAVESEDKTPVPEHVDDDVTNPVILIDRMKDQYDTDVVFRDELNAMRSEYEKNLSFRALFKMIRRQKRESGKTLSDIANASLEAHQDAEQRKADMEKIADLVTWKTEVDAILRLTKWILGFVIAAALGSIVVVVTKIYAFGESSGKLEDRMQNIERQLGTINHQQYQFSPSSSGEGK